MDISEQAVCLSLLADGDLDFVKRTHLAGIVHELLQLLLAVILPGADPSCAWGHGAPCAIGPSYGMSWLSGVECVLVLSASTEA